MKHIAVVIARGGSIRLPRKNARDFCGHPLVAWSITQALCSKTIDSVYLSTDDDELDEIGQSYGAKVIRRPDWPDANEVAANRVYLHAISMLEKKHGTDYGLVQLLPTSPLRRPEDLDKANYLWDECGGHLIAACKNRETFINMHVPGMAVTRPIIQDKSYRYMTPNSGLVNICTARRYRWFVSSMATDQDKDLDRMMANGEHPEGENFYIDCEPFQTWEVDTLGEFEVAEALMEKFILKGRGIGVYSDYAKDEAKE